MENGLACGILSDGIGALMAREILVLRRTRDAKDSLCEEFAGQSRCFVDTLRVGGGSWCLVGLEKSFVLIYRNRFGSSAE